MIVINLNLHWRDELWIEEDSGQEVLKVYLITELNSTAIDHSHVASRYGYCHRHSIALFVFCGGPPEF